MRKTVEVLCVGLLSLAFLVDLADRVIALPFYNNLTKNEVETVCKELKDTLNNLSG